MNRKEGDYKKKKEEKIEQILKKKGQKKSNTSGESRRYIKRKAMQLPYKRNDITPQKQCHCSVISS